jgi:ABC-2 type transport system permease protein
LGFFAFTIFSIVMAGYSTSSKTIAVVDDSGLFISSVFADAQDGSVAFVRVPHIADACSSTAHYDAIIHIPAHYDLEHPKKVTINCLSDQSMGLAARGYINRAFSHEVRLLRARSLHISPDQLTALADELDLQYQGLHADTKRTINAEIGVAMGYVMGMGIYILLLVYGTMIMRGVVEEKTNRIMEVLVSSVRPLQLMMGKVIGIGAVGLTQFLLWIGLILLGTALIPLLGINAIRVQTMSQGTVAAGNLDPDRIQQYIISLQDFHFGPLVLVFIFFFLGGFLLYGSLFAAIAAAAGDSTDSQSLTLPVMLPIVISFVLMTNAISQPEGSLALWASLIPLFSPIVMPALMPFDPPLWQPITSLLLLYGGFVLAAMLAAKIYRTGILMYGKKVTLAEIGKWVWR